MAEGMKSIIPGIRVYQLIRPDGSVAWSASGPKSWAARLRKVLSGSTASGYTLIEYKGESK